MSESHPIILWLGTDEQHRQSVGAHGSADCRTPEIDRLAARSLVFDNAFTTMAACAPARTSMLTGRSPSQPAAVAQG